MHQYFPAQQPNEEVVLVIRKHWFAYAKIFALSFLVLLITLFLFIVTVLKPEILSGVSYPLIIIFFGILALFIALFTFIGWLTTYLNLGIVTNQHIVDIDQTNLFHRKISISSLDDIQDVSASTQGVWQSWYNFGTVIIQTAGTNPNFDFTEIPHPYEVSQKISEVVEEYRDKHELHKRL